MELEWKDGEWIFFEASKGDSSLHVNASIYRAVWPKSLGLHHSMT